MGACPRSRRLTCACWLPRRSRRSSASRSTRSWRSCEHARLRGVRVGSPARWRVEEASVAEYLDEQAEEARRIALWHQSNEASFPELWGTGIVRNAD